MVQIGVGRLSKEEKEEKGTDLFFYTKAMRKVRIRVRKINLPPFGVEFSNGALGQFHDL